MCESSLCLATEGTSKNLYILFSGKYLSVFTSYLQAMTVTDSDTFEDFIPRLRRTRSVIVSLTIMLVITKFILRCVVQGVRFHPVVPAQLIR